MKQQKGRQSHRPGAGTRILSFRGASVELLFAVLDSDLVVP
jgi:hypothetical protein